MGKAFQRHRLMKAASAIIAPGPRRKSLHRWTIRLTRPSLVHRRWPKADRGGDQMPGIGEISETVPTAHAAKMKSPGREEASLLQLIGGCIVEALRVPLHHALLYAERQI